MARRSVLVSPGNPAAGNAGPNKAATNPAGAPPPGSPSRRTMVIRAGPPQKRGGRLDLAVGILGVILLVASVALVQILPQEKVEKPQFRVRVMMLEGEFFVAPADIPVFNEADARSHDITFEVPVDNVVKVTYVVGFEDDMPASLPDRFLVELRRPGGELVGSPLELISLDPLRVNEVQPGTSVDWQAQYTARTVVADHRTPPEEQIIEGRTMEETADEIQARLAAEYRLPTIGTWTVKARLGDAGDCPLPDPLQPDRSDRSASCFANDDNGQDEGNSFGVNSFKYTYFSIIVEPLI